MRPAGSQSRAPGPAGSFGAEAGLSDFRCSGTCEIGCYCPAGSTSSCPHPCTAGSYNPLAAQGNVSACLVCPIGSFCGVGAHNPIMPRWRPPPCCAASRCPPTAVGRGGPA